MRGSPGWNAGAAADPAEEGNRKQAEAEHGQKRDERRDEAGGVHGGEDEPEDLDRLADQARSLREWFRGFVRTKKGRALGADDLKELEPLNQLLSRDEGYASIVPSEGGDKLRFVRTRRWSSPESLLQPIGEAMAKLVAEEDFSYVKACEGPTCTLLFADHTRGHVRRWCSMAACGNRAKQTAHRQRARSAT